MDAVSILQSDECPSQCTLLTTQVNILQFLVSFMFVTLTETAKLENRILT
jgi:hypothetical protein